MASLRDLQRRLKTLEQAPVTKTKQAPPVVRVKEWAWHERTMPDGDTYLAPGIAAGMAERYPDAVLIVPEPLPEAKWRELSARHHSAMQEWMNRAQRVYAGTTKKPED